MKGNNILILSGLPGSGKTTFADTMALEDDTVFVYHQDEKKKMNGGCMINGIIIQLLLML